MAAVIVKYRSQTSWRTIKDQMQRKVGRCLEVVPFTDDRAVFWCVNEREMKTILDRSELYKGKDFLAKIKKWNVYLHWEYVQIEAKYSWIGVDGLPLNLWNLDTFQLIGEACGGLLEVARETKDQSFLMFAKLKVKGH